MEFLEPGAGAGCQHRVWRQRSESDGDGDAGGGAKRVSATITVTVSDGTLSASDSFVLTVNAVNTAPTISDVSRSDDQRGHGDGRPAFTVGDVGDGGGELDGERNLSNATLVPTGNIVFGGSGANRTVTVTPAANQSGTATITVTVSDGQLTASDTFAADGERRE